MGRVPDFESLREAIFITWAYLPSDPLKTLESSVKQHFFKRSTKSVKLLLTEFMFGTLVLEVFLRFGLILLNFRLNILLNKPSAQDGAKRQSIFSVRFISSTRKLVKIQPWKSDFFFLIIDIFQLVLSRRVYSEELLVWVLCAQICRFNKNSLFSLSKAHLSFQLLTLVQRTARHHNVSYFTPHVQTAEIYHICLTLISWCWWSPLLHQIESKVLY